MIDRYRDIVNFNYWRLHCEVGANARRPGRPQGDLRRATSAFHAADLNTAKKQYDEGLAKWRAVLDAFPDLMKETIVVDDLVDVINEYRRLLDQLDIDIPRRLRLAGRARREEPKSQAGSARPNRRPTAGPRRRDRSRRPNGPRHRKSRPRRSRSRTAARSRDAARRSRGSQAAGGCVAGSAARSSAGSGRRRACKTRLMSIPPRCSSSSSFSRVSIRSIRRSSAGMISGVWSTAAGAAPRDSPTAGARPRTTKSDPCAGWPARCVPRAAPNKTAGGRPSAALPIRSCRSRWWPLRT